MSCDIKEADLQKLKEYLDLFVNFVKHTLT